MTPLDTTIIVIGFVILVAFLTTRNKDKKYYSKRSNNPYFYITPRGEAGVDIDKMRREDPEMFYDNYVKPAKNLQRTFEKLGHKFEGGNIYPPITIDDAGNYVPPKDDK